MKREQWTKLAEQKKIRLIVVDDHALFREGVSYLLKQQPGFEVVGSYSTIASALSGMLNDNADIALLDVDLGKERALDFLRAQQEGIQKLKFLIVTAGLSDMEAMQLVHAGVRGIFHKHNEPAALCAAIDRVALGDVVLEPEYLKGLFAAVDPRTVDPRPHLTEREILLLRHLLQGLLNKEIATAMNLSESTVKALLRGLFEKTGVRNRSQLVNVALNAYREYL